MAPEGALRNFDGSFNSAATQIIGSTFDARNVNLPGSLIESNHGTVNNNFFHKGSTLENLVEPTFQIPFRRDDDFIDRGGLLAEIGKRCSQDAARIALVGIGGVGKSQLAIEYCYRRHERSPSAWIFWIHASNLDRLKQGFDDLAAQARITGYDNPQVNTFELVATWLRSTRSKEWFMVLDNIDDDQVITQSRNSDSASGAIATPNQQPWNLCRYLPQSRHGSYLLTSRRESVAEQLVDPKDVIVVDQMAVADAVSLLQHKLTTAVQTCELKELASKLDCIPLAIVQAAAYINNVRKRNPRYNIDTYIQEFEMSDQKQSSLLDYKAGQLRRDHEAHNSIIQTWQMSIEHILVARPSAVELLSLMSFFDRQGIPQDVLISKFRVQHDNNSKLADRLSIENPSYQESFDRDITVLVDFLFVSAEESGEGFRMHRLVQLATRTWLEMHGEIDATRSLFLKILNQALPDRGYSNWMLWDLLLPHAKASEKREPPESLDEQMADWTQILYKTADYAFKRGYSKDAEILCRKAVDGIRRSGASGIVNGLKLLWSIYDRLGRLKEAEMVGQELRNIEQAHISRLIESVRCAVIRKHVDWKRVSQHIMVWSGQEDLAVHIQQVMLNGDLSFPAHAPLLAQMNEIVQSYLENGDYETAETIATKVYDASKKLHGSEHPTTIIALQNLGQIYRYQKRSRESQSILEQVIEIKMRTLGPGHPAMLEAQRVLAPAYFDNGSRLEGIDMLKQAITMSARVSGVDNEDTISSWISLAGLYDRMGIYREAEEYNLQALEKSETILGPCHQFTVNCHKQLCDIYSHQGRWVDAEKSINVLMTKQKELYGQEHETTILCMEALVVVLAAQKRVDDVEETLKEVFDLRMKINGPNDLRTHSALSGLLGLYAVQERWFEARKILFASTGLSLPCRERSEKIDSHLLLQRAYTITLMAEFQLQGSLQMEECMSGLAQQIKDINDIKSKFGNASHVLEEWVRLHTTMVCLGHKNTGKRKAKQLRKGLSEYP